MRTPLYAIHQSLGAKMIDFAGWEMPVQYKGIIEEHTAVRTHAGIFDVSHMGRIAVEGEDAERFCDFVLTNTIEGKKDQAAVYGVLCREDGTSIDDVIIFRHSPSRCSVVSNASNRERVFEHLQTLSKTWKVNVTAPFREEGILAVQGPASLSIAEILFPGISEMAVMTVKETPAYILSRTGYTGEKGFEIFVPFADLESFWNKLTTLGIVPVGLGARDTLRLEKGYALYGHELSDTIAPTESVSSWSVKLKKSDFIGKKSLESSIYKRKQYGIVLQEAGVARADCPVYQNGTQIGLITSGSFSPTLKKSIAIAMTDKAMQHGDIVDVGIRDRRVKAVVVPLPFI